MKKSLQEVTDYRVMSVEEAMKSLGFTWTESENSYDNITCSCGEAVECTGFIGTEVIRCNKCNKEVVDLFSPIATSNSTVGVLNIDNFEYTDAEYWIAVDGKGGIKA